MKVRFDYKILIIICIFIITKQINLYLLLLFFTALHEVGHIVIAKILNQKIYIINILPVGLSVQLGININDYNNKFLKARIINLKKVLIGIAGPLTSLLIIYIIYFFRINTYFFNTEVLVYSNLLICLFNILPIYPMDGELVIRNLLKIICGMQLGNKIARIISHSTLIIITVVSSIVILKVHNIGIFLILVYLWYRFFKDKR